MRCIAKGVAVFLALCSASVASAGQDARWIEVEGGGWSPRIETLRTIEQRFESYVNAKARIGNRRLREWKTYTFQYQGREEHGRKFILINALCVIDERWKLNEQIIRVFDGGTCFFNLKYDPDKKLFYELHINGEA